MCTKKVIVNEQKGKRNMSGQKPDFIEKGKKVLYENTERIVEDYHFSCPCAIGQTNHHPSDDLLMVKFKGEKDFTPYDYKKFDAFTKSKRPKTERKN